MTCTELLLFIDDQRTLRPAAFKLLVHLIATGFRHRTNAISINTHTLAKELDYVKDTLHLASAELTRAGLIQINWPNKTRPKIYILPPEWFTDSAPPLCGHCGRPIEGDAGAHRCWFPHDKQPQEATN